MAGKLGRLPVDPANYARSAKFANFRPTTPVLIPKDMDVLATFAPGLKMLGNDQYGDCVAVTVANLIYMITGTLPLLDAVYEFYKSQNPGFPNEDNGMVIQTALEYLVKTGMRMPDGTYKKAVFFASVNHANQDEVEEMLALFGMGAYGIVVSTDNETEFDSGRVWTYVSGDDELGGHAVAGGGYVVDPLLRHFATWGQETSWNLTFDTSPRVDELWIVLFEEHVNGKVYVPGVVMADVAAEFQRVTGKPFPGAGPSPTPTPPVPVDADHYLASIAHRYLKSWWNSRTYMGKALKEWLAAKGL